MQIYLLWVRQLSIFGKKLQNNSLKIYYYIKFKIRVIFLKKIIQVKNLKKINKLGVNYVVGIEYLINDSYCI